MSTLAASAFPGIAAQAERTSSIFAPRSAPAESIHELSLLVLLVCAVIFVVVAALLVFAIVRYRHKSGDDAQEPPQVYGSNPIELAWTVVPVLIVFVLILATARTTADVQNAPPPPGALEVRVIGHQWWWEFRYPELGIATANELHVPLSTREQRRPTYLTLTSADVVHSFWVPELAGKTDAIPARENRAWIEPWEIGTYLGMCAEFCGTQHAKMMIRVIVQPPDEFERWVAEQQLAARAAPGVNRGRELFLSTACVNCHTVRGTGAAGTFGPDLTHLMSRKTLGAGAALNDSADLRHWVRDPQSLKPGCLMPDMQLIEPELDSIVAYLLTLR